MTKVTINGKSYEFPDGASVNVMSNNEVVINTGINVQSIGDSSNHKVVIEGNVGNVKAEKGAILVKGNVEGDAHAGTSISCNNVTKNVWAGSSVNCDNVGGNVTAGSSVNCDDVRGSVNARMVNRG